MKPEDNIKEVVNVLEELEQDHSVPKNIKTKIKDIIATLKEDKDISIKVNMALNELDDITDDANVQSYTRTQLYGVVSLLEKIS